MEGVRDLEMFKENSFLPTEESFKLRADNDVAFDNMLKDNIHEFGPNAAEVIAHRLKKYERKVET